MGGGIFSRDREVVSFNSQNRFHGGSNTQHKLERGNTFHWSTPNSYAKEWR